jgi:hypothetical protein
MYWFTPTVQEGKKGGGSVQVWQSVLVRGAAGRQTFDEKAHGHRCRERGAPIAAGGGRRSAFAARVNEVFERTSEALTPWSVVGIKGTLEREKHPVTVEQLKRWRAENHDLLPTQRVRWNLL